MIFFKKRLILILSIVRLIVIHNYVPMRYYNVVFTKKTMHVKNTTTQRVFNIPIFNRLYISFLWSSKKKTKINLSNHRLDANKKPFA